MSNQVSGVDRMKGTVRQDVNGKESSKRLIGFLSFGVAGLIALIGLIFDKAMAPSLVYPFIGLVAAILGVTVFERKSGTTQGGPDVGSG